MGNLAAAAKRVFRIIIFGEHDNSGIYYLKSKIQQDFISIFLDGVCERRDFYFPGPKIRIFEPRKSKFCVKPSKFVAKSKCC